MDPSPELPQDLRFERDAWKRFQDRHSGAATQSQLHSQVAPKPEEAQRIMNLPTSLGALPLQNTAGKAYFMVDYDRVGDPKHPLR